MQDNLTIDYAQGYMDGTVAVREEITKMITLEMTKRDEAPLPIKHWTLFLLDMINRNDKSEEEVLNDATKRFEKELREALPLDEIMEAIQEHIRHLQEEEDNE